MSWDFFEDEVKEDKKDVVKAVESSSTKENVIRCVICCWLDFKGIYNIDPTIDVDLDKLNDIYEKYKGEIPENKNKYYYICSKHLCEVNNLIFNVTIGSSKSITIGLESKLKSYELAAILIPSEDIKDEILEQVRKDREYINKI